MEQEKEEKLILDGKKEKKSILDEEKEEKFTLDDIFFDFWVEENHYIVDATMKLEMEVGDEDYYEKEIQEKLKQVKKDYEASEVKSKYRKNLNQMCKALFGLPYESILIQNKDGNKRKSYDIRTCGYEFLMFLLRTYSSENARVLRSKSPKRKDEQTENKNMKEKNTKNKKVDRAYINDLLYHAAQYLEEREKQEDETDILTHEMKRLLVEGFHINNKALELIKSLMDFNNMISAIIYDYEIESGHQLEEIYEISSKKINKVISEGFDGIVKYISHITDEELELIKKLKDTHKKVAEPVISPAIQRLLELEGKEFVSEMLKDLDAAEGKTVEIIHEATAKGVDGLAKDITEEAAEQVVDYMDYVDYMEDNV